MARKVVIPQTGVELCVGEPGAGKSYWLIERLITAIQVTKRPVYTNLPLRWRVVREYLATRGGSELRNLIRPLSRDHFFAFLRRFAERQRFIDDCRTGKGMSRKEASGAWRDHAGPDVIEGDGAQWLPFGSIVVVDEVHHWTPNTMIVGSGGGRESEHLLAWLTMHRHGTYWIWAATQALRQVSPTWRSLASQVHQVINASARPLVFGITAADFGIRSMLRRSYSKEAWCDGTPDPKLGPHDQSLIFPSLPWNRWRFRLYDSFTHIGSRRELAEAVAHVRELAGVTDKPAEPVERPRAVKGRFNRLVYALVGFAVFGAGSWVVSGCLSPAREVEPEVSEVVEASKADVEPAPTAEPAVLRAVTGRTAYFKNGPVTVGDIVDARRIIAVHAPRGLVLAVGDDNVLWLYAVGRGSRVVGPAETFLRALGGAAAGRARGLGAGAENVRAVGIPGGSSGGVDGARSSGQRSGEGGLSGG